MGKLLIIAGMPCSGKSTLLRNSIESGTNIFDEADGRILKSTCIPPRNMEILINIEQKIQDRYWLNELDLVSAKVKDITLNSHLIHFDLYAYYISMLMTALKIKHQNPNTLPVIKQKTVDTKIQIEIFRTIRQLLPQNTELTIKILEPDYNELCDRWIRRSGSTCKYTNKQEFLHHHIYNHSSEGKEICESLIKSFQKIFDF